MAILFKILQLLLCLSILVMIHEFGHFMFAKIFKIRVEKFYLFFDPWFSLFKFKRGDTEYGIGWLPLGGYVKLSGMIDESMDTKQMASEPKPYEFRSKAAWKRFLVLLGGVMMNALLACVIYMGISYKWGDQYISNNDLRWGYSFNDLGHEIGFREGDRIVALDGNRIDDVSKIYQTIVIDQVKKVTVQRGDSLKDVYIRADYTPKLLNSPDFMMPRIPFVVASVADGTGAQKAGVQVGDSVIAIGSKPVSSFYEVRSELQNLKDSTALVVVARGTAVDSLNVAISADGTMGVMTKPFTEYVPVHTRTYTFWESIPAGFRRTGTEMADYWDQLKLIVKPKTEAYKSLGSFIAIGNIFPSEWDWYSFWRITALLSVIFAIMNILPIPGLDGGHLVFVLWEMITGRKPSDKVLEYAQIVGMVLLIALMVLAFGNDIRRFIL